VTAEAVGLVKVMVISELLPSVIESGANDFEPEAAPSVTLSVDELVLRPMLTVAVLLIVWPMRRTGCR